MNEPLDRERLLDLVGAYALGVLPAADVPIVASFILSDPQARREFDTLRATADVVGLAAEEPVDSARTARMKERLMASVRTEAAPRRVPSTAARTSAMWGTGLAAAAAVAFALVSVIQNFGLRSDLSTSQRTVATLQQRLKAQRRAIERDRAMLADLAASDAKRYPVTFGTVVRRGDRLYLALRGLPPPGAGKVYQAWTLAKTGRTMMPSVTFTASQSGLTLVLLPENAGNLAAVALSVEPQGGSRQPTTKPAFVLPLS